MNNKIFIKNIDIKHILLFLICFDMICACEGTIVLSDLFKYIFWTIEFILFGTLIIPDFLKRPILTKEKVLLCALCLLSGISVLLSHNRSLLYVFLTCWIIKDDDFKKILNYLFYCILTILCFEVIVYLISKYLLGIEQVVYYRSADKIRYSFGVGHPNHFALFVYNLVLIKLYINYKKYSILNYLLFLVIFIITFVLSDCRTVLLLSIFTLFVFYIAKLNNKLINKIFKISAAYMFPALGIIIFILMYLYTNNIEFVNKLNELLSGRIYLSVLAIKNYGITLFGQYTRKMETVDNVKFIIETIWPYFLCYFGSIWLVLFTILIPKSIKNSNIEDCILIIVFCIYSVSEHLSLNYVLLCSLLLFKNLFIVNNNKIE